MNKQELKRFGGWVSLFGGLIFLGSAFAAIYVAFFIPHEEATRFILWLSHVLRHKP